MTRFRRPQQYTIAQLVVMIAGIAVILALLRSGAVIGLMVVSACLYLVQRTRAQRGASGGSLGCLCAILGFVGGAVWGAIATRNSINGLQMAGAAIVCSIFGGLVGQVISFALDLGRQPEAMHKRSRPCDEVDRRRTRLLAEYKFLETLISQAAKDGDSEVFTKLTAYRAKLKNDLGL